MKILFELLVRYWCSLFEPILYVWNKKVKQIKQKILHEYEHKYFYDYFLLLLLMQFYCY